MARSFQIASLFLSLTVLHNTRLALQGIRPSRFQMFRPAVGYKNIHTQAEELLKSMDLWEKGMNRSRGLAYGEQRKLEIALSLAANPRLLLLDEPSCGLTSSESADITSRIRALGTKITVVLVAHDMDLVFGVAQRIIVLHYGELIIDGACDMVRNHPKVKEIYMGAEAGKDMLELKDIHTYYGDSYILQGVSLKVNEGSVVALLGRNGMGKTTTIRSIIGIAPPRKGEVIFKGENVAGLPSYAIARKGIGLVPQGREIFPSLSVKENLTMAARGGERGERLDSRENI